MPHRLVLLHSELNLWSSGAGIWIAKDRHIPGYPVHSTRACSTFPSENQSQVLYLILVSLDNHHSTAVQERMERTEEPLSSQCIVSLSADHLQSFRSGITNNRRITIYIYSRRIEVTNNRSQLMLLWHRSYGGKSITSGWVWFLALAASEFVATVFNEKGQLHHIWYSMGSLEIFLSSLSPSACPGPCLILLSKATKTLSHAVDSEAI